MSEEENPADMPKKHISASASEHKTGTRTRHKRTPRAIRSTEAARVEDVTAASTPVVEESPLEKIVDTPVPITEEEDDTPIVAMSMAGEPLAAITETPRPDVLAEGEEDSTEERAAVAALPVRELLTPYPIPVTEAPLAAGGKQRLPLPRILLACTLLLVLLVSSLLLWHRSSDTHLFVSTLDATSGQVLAQQDIGDGYQDTTMITTPVSWHNALYVGVRTGEARQEIISLVGADTALQVQGRFPVALAHGTLSVAPGGSLVVERASGVALLASDGRLLWQAQGDLPTLGEHSFQPAFDSTTLYTVKSTQLKQIAAYDLRTGAIRWIQKLDDTLDYAAPLLLNGNTLYLASDHQVYALNTSDGSLRWNAGYPARTLLMSPGGQMLLVASAQGVVALDPDNGALLWSFHGRTKAEQTTLTATQFYQASSRQNTIYATGIAWDTSQIREQLWLYAIDASTGAVSWSRLIGSDFHTVDAGRAFAPLLDQRNGLVVLQSRTASGELRVSAFEADSGTPRWTMDFQGVSAVAPALYQTASGGLILVSTIPDAMAQDLSPFRMGMLALLLFSIAGLLALWLFPARRWEQRLGFLARATRLLPRLFQRPWRFSSRLLVLFLLLLIGADALIFPLLNQRSEGVYQLATQTGAVQWQYSGANSVQPALAGAQGSILHTMTSDHLSQLTVLGSNGRVLWKTFSSEGTFSALALPGQPDRVFVALNGLRSQSYLAAPNDPAYPDPLTHQMICYLFDRSTGQLIWQNTVLYPDAGQRGVVLGADANNIYIASTQSLPSRGSSEAIVSLFAVDQATGGVGWRIFGPVESGNVPGDNGWLFTRGRQLIWQVAGAIYAIDTSLGQLEWRQFLKDDPAILSQEEAQVAQLPGALVIARSDAFYVLDVTSGNILWNIPSPVPASTQTPHGMAVVGAMLVVSAGGKMQAFDVTTRQRMWQRDHLGTIQSLRASDSGSLVYAQLGAGAGERSSESLEAFDANTGTTLWTFQPTAAAWSGDLQSTRGILLVTFCFGSLPFCENERLYALDVQTGHLLWKVEGDRISHVHVSADGTTILAQVISSPWLDFVAHFRS